MGDEGISVGAILGIMTNVLFTFGFLVCVGCCILRCCVGPRNPDESQAKQNNMLKKKFVKHFQSSLKRFRQQSGSKGARYLADTGSCPICFEDYKKDPAEELIGYIKRCGHYFHFDCIWRWLEKQKSCPICRDQVTLTEEDIKGISLRHLVHLKKDTDKSKASSSSQTGNSVKSNDDNPGLTNPAFWNVDETMTSSATSPTTRGNMNSREVTVTPSTTQDRRETIATASTTQDSGEIIATSSTIQDSLNSVKIASL